MLCLWNVVREKDVTTNDVKTNVDGTKIDKENVVQKKHSKFLIKNCYWNKCHYSLIFAQYGVLTDVIIANVLRANVGAHIKRSSRWTFSSNPATKKVWKNFFVD